MKIVFRAEFSKKKEEEKRKQITHHHRHHLMLNLFNPVSAGKIADFLDATVFHFLPSIVKQAKQANKQTKTTTAQAI